MIMLRHPAAAHSKLCIHPPQALRQDHYPAPANRRETLLAALRIGGLSPPVEHTFLDVNAVICQSV